MLSTLTAAVVVGHSVQHRPIELVHVSGPGPRVLVVGCIHGNEPAGIAVVRALERAHPHADLWLVPVLNPDGLAAGTRQNAHGVDLNRNFGAMWQPLGQPGSRQYSGPRPFSEPESRAVRALILRLHPQITIWFHQPQGVVRAWGQSVPTARRFAVLARYPYRSIEWPYGTAANWQNHAFPGTSSFVVELPAGSLSSQALARHVGAVLHIAK